MSEDAGKAAPSKNEGTGADATGQGGRQPPRAAPETAPQTEGARAEVPWAAIQEAIRTLGGPKGLTGLTRQLEAAQEAMRTLGSLKSLTDQLAAVQNSLKNLYRVSSVLQAPAFPEALVGSLRPLLLSVPEVHEEREGQPPSWESSRPHLGAYEGHAPDGWAKSKDGRRFADAIKNGDRLYVVVLAADIRSSTVLMKEAVDSYQFASIIGEFVERARKGVWDRNGLFDKFTGDGFLAYWAPPEDHRLSVLRSILDFVWTLHEEFRSRYVPLLRANSRNFPEKVGLGIGLDHGDAHPVAIAGDATIVGPAVVGAVRMVDQARGGETVANVHLGTYLERAAQEGSLRDISIIRVRVPSKEYEEQTAYAITRV